MGKQRSDGGQLQRLCAEQKLGWMVVSRLLMIGSQCIDRDEWDAENLSLGKGLKRFSQPGFFDSTLF